jgi:hypothetical protein
MTSIKRAFWRCSRIVSMSPANGRVGDADGCIDLDIAEGRGSACNTQPWSLSTRPAEPASASIGQGAESLRWLGLRHAWDAAASWWPIGTLSWPQIMVNFAKQNETESRSSYGANHRLMRLQRSRRRRWAAQIRKNGACWP